MAENDTGFKDIYMFIAFKLKQCMPSYTELITRDLVKRRIMPGTYGQTLHTFKDEARKILSENIT
jgi:hypothetical protein